MKIEILNNRIKRLVNLPFNSLIPFQIEGMVEMTERSAEKLQQSLEGVFIEPFAIWINNDRNYILNGHQRQKILKANGFNKDVLCLEIECKNEKEAAEFVLLFRSVSGRIVDEKLYEFIELKGLDFSELKTKIDFADLNLGTFEYGYFKDVELDIIEGNRGSGDLDHFYEGNSRPFRLGDFMAYISDQKLIDKIQTFTDKIINKNEDQKYLNIIGQKMAELILENETLFL